MLGNFKISFIEELRNIRAETMTNDENNLIADLAEKYFNKQGEFKSMNDLNEYMKKLGDEDFELFVENILKVIEDEKNS